MDQLATVGRRHRCGTLHSPDEGNLHGTEAYEVAATGIATPRPSAYPQKQPGKKWDVIVVKLPRSEIQSIAPRASRIDRIAKIDDTCGESLVAFAAADLLKTKGG
jgi:hypothetical protein